MGRDGPACCRIEWVALLMVGSALLGPEVVVAQAISYPASRQSDVDDDYHGTGVADPYRPAQGAGLAVGLSMPVYRVSDLVRWPFSESSHPSIASRNSGVKA